MATASGWRGMCTKPEGKTETAHSGEPTEEDFERIRTQLQESCYPMFMPTVHLKERVTSSQAYKYPLPSQWWAIIRYHNLVDPEFTLPSFIEGVTQARKYVIQQLTDGDFDAIELVAAREVVDAFRATRELWDNSKETGFEIKYSVDSIDELIVVDSRIIWAEDDDADATLYQKIYRFCQRDLILCVFTDHLAVSGRLEVDVVYKNHERYRVTKTDGELMDAAMDRPVPVERAWRFSKEFAPGDGGRSPWLLSAIL